MRLYRRCNFVALVAILASLVLTFAGRPSWGASNTPTLTVVGDPLNFAIASGNSSAPSVTYTVDSTVIALHYTITGLPSWLSLSGSAGFTDPTQFPVFSVNNSASGLAPGTYTAKIAFTNALNGAGNTTRTATLTVTANTNSVTPTLTVVGDPLNFAITSGNSSAPSVTYTVDSTVIALHYTITGLPSWVSLSNSAGFTDPTQFPVFSINGSASGLAPGTYTATIVFTNSLNGAGNTTRTATLTVSSDGGSKNTPTLTVSGNPLDFATTSGTSSAPSVTYTVGSTLTALHYTITGLPAWLSVSNSSGFTNPTQNPVFSLSGSAAGLAPGTYTADIAFTNSLNGAGNTTRTATLTVSPSGGSKNTPTLTVTGAPLNFVSKKGSSIASITYTVDSTVIALHYSITGLPSWLAVSNSAGFTDPTQNPVFSVTSSASSLASGTYTASIAFTNLLNGAGNTTRTATLTVADSPSGPQPTGSRDPTVQPFSSTSLWNTAIGANAQWSQDGDADSRDIRAPGGFINAGQWSHPFYVGSYGDPVRLFRDTDGFRPVADAMLYTPNDVQPSQPSGGDQHISIYSADHRWLYQYWGCNDNGNGFTCGLGQKDDVCGDGLGEYGFGTGDIRIAELKAAVIPHMLRYAISTGHTRSGGQFQGGQAWPATIEDYNGSQIYSGNVLFGSTVGIPSGIDINSLGLSGPGLALARALQDYGALQRDTTGGGGGITFYAETAAEGMQELDAMRNDVDKIIPYLAIMRNQAPNTPNGGGTRRQSQLAAIDSSICP